MMKALSVVLLMAAAGIVQAGETESCGSAVEASVKFMTATYGGYPDDVLVQITSAKKNQKDQLVADVITSTGNHKCALKLSPASQRKDTLYICQWSLQVVSCDSPEVMKQTIIDEPSWVASKASAKAWREGMQNSFEKVIAPAESTEMK
ncbi:exported hypothetical protein [Pseudomonas veronii]|uniref:hypothetical protein n=1 Tax=Pseudomonas veronii TaxID=76761 RepID=UPI0017723CFE|nr:hypothetical protein [Pseudomonas veronii]CAD0266082.1 exported hypothetical protein [Pseudomonas veronii]